MSSVVVPLSRRTDISGVSDACKQTTKDVLVRNNVWDDFCQWSSIWLMMPDVAYQLTRCLTLSIPDARGRVPLVGQCFVDAAKEIQRWPHCERTMNLVAAAMRAMMRRALVAARYVVTLDDGYVWQPDVDGPLEDCLRARSVERPSVSRRQGGTEEAALAIHRMLSTHVYIGRCAPNLRRTYADLMHVSPELLQ